MLGFFKIDSGFIAAATEFVEQGEIILNIALESVGLDPDFAFFLKEAAKIIQKKGKKKDFP